MTAATPEPDGNACPGAHYNAADIAAGPDNCGFLIKLVQQSLSRMMDQAIAPLELTAMQWRPLALVAHQEANTPAELARIIGVDTGAMTRTLDRLEAKGLLRRTRSQEDRRVVKLEATEAGQLKAREIPVHIAQTLNQHLCDFSAEEVAQLRHLLARMLANGTPPSS